METIRVQFTEEISMDIPLEDAVRIIEGAGIDPVQVPISSFADVIQFAFQEFAASAASELEEEEGEGTDE